MLTALAFSLTLANSSLSLPGRAPIGMDYLVYEPGQGRVWVPAGNSGNVDVVDTATGKLTAIGGFKTAPSPRPDRPGMGPSSATVGDGVVWIGNRGDNQICAFDLKTLAKHACVQLPTMPDGLAFVASTHEVWATTPRDQTITIASPAASEEGAPLPTVKLPGEPEGYAVDQARGIFYTNLEDRDQTLAIDVKTHKILSTWAPGCGSEGPRGLAIDPPRRLLLVACTDGAVALDLAHDGRILGRIKTGKGVDNIDYLPARGLLYIASGRAPAGLTIAHLTDAGALILIATLPTVQGARNVVVDASGKAYLPDSAGGKLLVVDPPVAP